MSGRVQLALSGCVAALLLSAVLVSAPSMSLDNWTPFAPEGLGAVDEAPGCTLVMCA